MKRLAVSFVLLLLVMGCNGSAPSNLRTIQMPIGSKTYTLEVADTADTREHGLMKRDSLPADRGMIFVFPDVTERTFWMKHTRIPLDIIYIDPTGKVVSTATMKPYDLGKTPSNGASKYAIELNAGQVKANGVKAGDQLAIPNNAKDTKN